MPINRDSATPLKTQITEDLRHRLVAGEFPIGQKFPSFRQLSAEYKVAELTVQAAVQELQREGVLETVSGRGTFVRALPESREPGEGSPVLAELHAIRSELTALRGRVETLEDKIAESSSRP